MQYGVGLRPSFTLEAGTSHTLEAYSIYQVPWELSRILNWLTLHFFRSVAVVLCLDRRHIELVVFTAAGLSRRAASTRCCLQLPAWNHRSRGEAFAHVRRSLQLRVHRSMRVACSAEPQKALPACTAKTCRPTVWPQSLL